MSSASTAPVSPTNAPGLTADASRGLRAWIDALPRHPWSSYRCVDPYSREQFGPPWHNPTGVSTVQEILRRDLKRTHLDQRGNICSGTLTCPYTGRVTHYEPTFHDALRDPDRRSDTVVIDHVVSLAEAWAAGAWAWPMWQRARFARDPANLVATTWDVNEEKGALSASQWHPRSAAARPGFARRITWIKHAYVLDVTDADRAFLRDSLRRSWWRR